MSEAGREQTPSEELANAITHGVGLLLSVACVSAGLVFAVLRRDLWTIVSVAIYGTTLCLLYLASTLYHNARSPGARRVWNVIDHSAIYLLIAGTYTPFTLGPMRTNGGWGWAVFGVIWLLAITGVVSKVLFVHRYHAIAVVAYVLMGWLSLVAIRPLWQSVGTAGILWLAAGGLCYTLGVAFYAMTNARFAHAVWHLFVLAGSGLHYLAVLLFVVLPGGGR